MSAPAAGTPGLIVACACGEVYELRLEYAGTLLECPTCKRHLRAGPATPAERAPAPGADPAFDHDRFLLHQRALAIRAKYEVLDDGGRPLLYVERPTYPFRQLLAVLAGLLAVGIVVSLLGALEDTFGAARAALLVVGAIAAPLVFFAVVFAVQPLRHVTFYRDDSRRERLLEVRQDQRVAFVNRTFTVRLADGTTLARLRKNYVHNLVRKRWYAHAPDGRLIAMAIEDSVILSLLRRVLGPLFGFLRTNFLLVRGDHEEVFGEFNRKFTLLDRYVLDITADPGRTVDRRVALALGVMLDTGERR
jgi:uncharacterized protein YxjI